MKKKLLNLVATVLIAIGFNLPNVSNATELEEIERNQNAISGFIAKRDNEIIQEIGKYDDRHSPFSTFKVPLALMGFNEEILKTKNSPIWHFKEEYEENFQDWYTREKGLEYSWCQDHTPETFMKYSVVWFSHQITERLGREKFQGYISRLNYGNMDVSGTPGKDDGLLNSWLGTSLEISPREQVEFLEKLCANKLDLSKETQEKTREIMNRNEEWAGWKLYGKTGGGAGRNGWFVGWIEKDEQRIIFAQYLDMTDPTLDLTDIPPQKSVGLTAKEVAKKNLWNFL
ncbi:class D beta-lactamase [Candidatus Paracaedibacter symbiosus]|uniref:class D beta-lactamase n=1 Tax=Candidatus Paracaedibacter symbiosus TaxID=244582 RepID=UPI000A4F6ECC|nr:class D beta-lactamase [Candidatus Paracaedibacter symbiosus]